MLGKGPGFAVQAGVALGVVLDVAVGRPAYGQTFSQAQSATLNSVCAAAFPPSVQVKVERPGAAQPSTETRTSTPTIQLGANLKKVCEANQPRPNVERYTVFEPSPHGPQKAGISLTAYTTTNTTTITTTTQGSPSVATSGGGAQLPFTSATTIQERLEQIRVPEEEKPESSTKAPTYSFNETSNRVGNVKAVPLPPVTGGAFPGIIVGLVPGLSLYLSGGGSTLTHFNNRFEDGYEATVPTVTAGGDYLINPWLLAGLAFTYNNIDGHYDDGSGFGQNIYGGFLYATLLPLNAAFINVTLGYARQDNSNKRPVDPATTTVGRTSSNYDTNQYTAAMLAGYDYPIGNITIGPRLGASFAHWQTDDFTERGSTGLELRYSGLDQTSVQTNLGVQGTISIRTSFGLLLPQAAVAWVHEFANDARNVQARFVEASPSPEFTFQREPPARNWANMGLGITAMLPNGLQPFAQFATIQGNENFVSYGGTAGVRLGL